MVKCKSKNNNLCGKCIVDCNSKETIGGAVCCDIAEDLGYNRSDILTKCEFAEPTDINNAAIKELFN